MIKGKTERRKKLHAIVAGLEERGYAVRVLLETTDISRFYLEVSKNETCVKERVFFSGSVQWHIETIMREHETQYERDNFRSLSVIF